MANAEVQVTIGSLNFNSATAFSTGVGYFLEETPALLNTLTTRHTTMEKQSDHGVVDSLSFYNGRSLPFKGTIVGSSQADRKAKEEALKAALALASQQNYATSDGYMLVLITDEDATLKQCYAKIDAPPFFHVLDNTDPTIRTFEFSMFAKDKNLYSQSLQAASGTEVAIGTNFTIVQSSTPKIPFTLYKNTPASCTVVSAGTVGTPPIITITGPTQSPIVYNVTTGKYLSFPGLTLLAGETLTIDVSASSILKTVSGVSTDASGYLDTANSKWVYIEAGTNLIALVDSSPDVIVATISVSWRDASL